MRIIKGIISAGLVAVCAVLIVHSFGKRISENRGKWPESPLVGKTAPAFLLKTFDGKTLNLKDFKDKILVLNFWASWCRPCAEEVGEINKAQRKYGDRVVFLGVNVMDDIEDALNFASKNQIIYQNGYDPEKTVHLDYGVAGVPETFFINSHGEIWRKISGPLTLGKISKTLLSDTAKQN